MNTVFLARALGSHLAVDDPAALPDDAMLDVLAAINGGLSDYYQLAPEVYRKTTISQTLRAPETITVKFVERYSNAVTDTEFLSRHVGCTLRVDGFPLDNRVASCSTVLDDWLGNVLENTATVFSDAVAVNAVIERITSAVEIRGLEAQCRHPLRPCEPKGRDYHKSPARPCEYWMESAAMNQGGQTASYLRVHPLPDTDYLLSFTAVLGGAKRITILDLIEAAEIPVAHSYAESILLPICESILTTSALWRDRNTKNNVLNRAEEAKTKLGLLPEYFNPPMHSVGTPRGY